MDPNLNDIRFITLWPTHLMMTTLLVDPQPMIDEVYNLAQAPNEIKKSNYGGWQSETDLYINKAFQPICSHVADICSRVFNVKGTKFHQMWACINKKYDQNLIHSHSNAFNLSGVCYLKVPTDSGSIVFRDPRPGSIHAPDRLFNYGDSEYFVPFDNMLILFPSYLEHFVLPNLNDEDRISVSFDITLER
jgi:uncharacterized protein (TIGR02466 family)